MYGMFFASLLVIGISLLHPVRAATATSPEPQPAVGAQAPSKPAATPQAKADEDEAKEKEAKEEKDKEKEDEPKQKPFATLIKKAKATEGFFTFYRTEDEKVYLEVRPDQWDKLYMLSLTCESGLGERGFYAAQMCGEAAVVLHKHGKQAQLVARNPRFTADEGTPIARAVARSFSDSIIATTTIESLPHPERKSELLDLNALLLTDLPNVAYFLEATFRIPYKHDAKQSAFGSLRVFEQNAEMEVRSHYVAERLPVPPLPGGGPQPKLPPPPRNIPDPRSLLLTFRYSLSEMPPDGYRPRLADDRVGHFFTQAEDFTTDIAHEPARRYVTRWRLEKTDPSAAMSRPKQPIVFWLENTIPVGYRDAVKDGVLMWNRAFEKIGFIDAIEARQQPDDADWDPADVRYSTIRWFTATDAGFAIGPSRVNPFTGEIYDADISFSENMTRFARREAIEEVQPLRAEPRMPTAFQPPWSASRFRALCDLPQGAAADAAFAHDLLSARAMNGPLMSDDDFIRAFLKYVTAHEVGHTLGLRHNFHASTIHTFEQLQDATRTGELGLTGSVMDYIPANLAAAGAEQGELFQTTIGPYDYWAVEYAYKPIAADSPAAELPELQKIAGRVSEPLLAYATDEDAGFFAEPFEVDPLANRFDLGAEPLKYYAHRVQLGRELWKRSEDRLLKSGDGYQVLRRSFGQALGNIGYSAYMASKYIGGIRYYRDHVGDPHGRTPFDPVPLAEQHAALNLLTTQLFAPDAFSFSPALLRQLAGDRYPDWVNFERMQRRPDLPLHTMLLGMQTAVLDRVLHPVVLSRVLDSQMYFDDPSQAFTLDALFAGVQEAIWRDTLKADGLTVNTYRRALQRAHLKKLADLAVKDGDAPEDARSLARRSLTTLRDQLRKAGKGKNVEENTRAHLEDSVARIEQVLNATVQRVGY
jgi:hypothetical protein